MIGVFLGTGMIPTINSNGIRIFVNDNHTIGIDIATRAASGKLLNLNKINFSRATPSMGFLRYRNPCCFWGI